VLLYAFSFVGTANGILPPADGTVFNTAMKCAVMLAPLLLVAALVMFVKDDTASFVADAARRASPRIGNLWRQATVALQGTRARVTLPTTVSTAQRFASSRAGSVPAPHLDDWPSTVLHRLKQLEDENAKLWNMVADLRRDMDARRQGV
jgi:hypothetical protein